jgi:uncharacterized membrane protein YgcG
MSARRAAPWLLAAICVVAVGLTLGAITAPGAASQQAQPVEGPHGLSLPDLAKAAGLPALKREPALVAAGTETPSEATEATSEVGESYVPITPEPGGEEGSSSGSTATGGSGGGSSGGGGGGGVIESP